MIGTVVAPAATVQPGMSFYVPGVTVYRNGAVPYSSTQRVDVTYYLQYYSNGNWVLANQFTQHGMIQNGPSVTFSPLPIQPYYVQGLIGHWRVAYAVQWRGSWAATDYVTPVDRHRSVRSERRIGHALRRDDMPGVRRLPVHLVTGAP